MPDQPNVLFIITDQHRGDCIGVDPTCPTDSDGHSVIHTPNINQLVQNGAIFTRAYTPAPSCVPARRCLWTGRTPTSADATYFNMRAEWDWNHTLPSELTDAGYQSWLVGKSHSIPHRNHFGFEHFELHDGLPSTHDEYTDWLAQQSDEQYGEISHGVDRNSWDSRPSHLEEHEHPTNWTTNRALEFLERRDPTRPFFLSLSYVRPHQPFDPPQVYWDMYIDRDLPSPHIGDWVDEMYTDRIPKYPHPDAWLADLPPHIVHRARAGYYGSITHIDHQLNRVFGRLRRLGELSNTIIVFTSDHGEMLGDHYHWRKTFPYEGSARVPFIINFHENMDYEPGQLITRPVGLEDVMPTLLEAVDVSLPNTVEGRSLLRLLEDEQRDNWRDYYHGEHGSIYDPENATQYLVDEQIKYIWNPVTGDELLFNLEADPGETHNLATDSDYKDETARWRQKLVDHLADRPEGFSDGEALHPVDSDKVWG